MPTVARMERSEIRDSRTRAKAPGYASLHPGYSLLQPAQQWIEIA